MVACRPAVSCVRVWDAWNGYGSITIRVSPHALVEGDRQWKIKVLARDPAERELLALSEWSGLTAVALDPPALRSHWAFDRVLAGGRPA